MPRCSRNFSQLYKPTSNCDNGKKTIYVRRVYTINQYIHVTNSNIHYIPVCKVKSILGSFILFSYATSLDLSPLLRTSFTLPVAQAKSTHHGPHRHAYHSIDFPQHTHALYIPCTTTISVVNDLCIADVQRSK